MTAMMKQQEKIKVLSLDKESEQFSYALMDRRGWMHQDGYG